MATIRHVTVEAADDAAARSFYDDVLGSPGWLHVRASDAPTSGFRGCTLSFVLPQPTDVDDLVTRAVAGGATRIKPPARSLWGYGGVVEAPDGTLLTVASAAKKDRGPATGEITDVVLQLGVTDVAASREFYVGRGFAVAKAYGRRYVELDTGSGPVSLSLYRRPALAKVVGIPAAGTGSHRVVAASDAGPFTDPDGFVWEAADG